MSLYDFGTLGKWSRETLNQQKIEIPASLTTNFFVVRIIEEVYDKKIKSFFNEKDKYMNMGIGVFKHITIGNLYAAITRVTEIENDIVQLNIVYSKYQKVMGNFKK